MEVQIPSATELRLEGRVAGIRPEIHLENTPLEISPPAVKDSPRSPVDTILVLGMGPVDPFLVGTAGFREVTINKPRMRNNVIAASELATRGFLKDGGIIAPSGTSTADPEIVKNALGLSKEEAAIVDHTSEATLMAKLLNKTRTKVKDRQGASITVADKDIEIVPDHLATETADNFIYVLNELDRRSREENGTLFDGSIVAITSRYHIPRTMETARYLGIGDQVVPLISQKALKTFGYGENGLPIMDSAGEEYDITARENEVRWIHATHDMPKYFLPVLGNIEDNERFISTLQHLQGIYGPVRLNELGIGSVNLDNVDELRRSISEITRTNPANDEWFKSQVGDLNIAIDGYEQYTDYWLAVNTPDSPGPMQ